MSDDPVAVVNILAPKCDSGQVAVFVLPGVICVVAVLALLIDERESRNCELQFPELLKKRSTEIELAAVVQRVPSITPPNLLLVHFERGIRRIHRDNLGSREVTLALVHVSLIAERESSLLTAVGAVGGFRHIDLSLECTIVIGHGERCAAGEAGFHDNNLRAKR